LLILFDASAILAGVEDKNVKPGRFAVRKAVQRFADDVGLEFQRSQTSGISSPNTGLRFTAADGKKPGLQQRNS
jgi:hypothetical protein